MNEPIITVGIMSQPSIEFVLNGEFKANEIKYSGEQKAIYKNGKISFNNESYTELFFEATSNDNSFDLMNVVIGIGFHWEREENQRFKGSLKLIVEYEKLTAINRINVEDYLTSVISSEMSATASVELLKSHAIISRSWLLCPLQEPGTKSQDSRIENLSKENIIRWYERDAHAQFDVCADDHCQRYQGITRVSAKTAEDAVKETNGEVLMYEDKICDARFSKSCGGVTETFENCWAPVHHPYLSKIVDNPTNPDEFNLNLTKETNAEKWIRNSPDAFCNTTDKNTLNQVLNNYDQETTDFYRWKVEYSQSEIASLISRRSGIDFGEIINLIPNSRGESGRILRLKIIGTKKTISVGKELEIRKWLSESHLYSSAFVVDATHIVEGIPQKFTLTGAGWGHGVGLCQIGAAVMGEKGYKYDEILMHYFKGAELKRIY